MGVASLHDSTEQVKKHGMSDCESQINNSHALLLKEEAELGSTWLLWKRKRYVLTFMAFLGNSVQYCLMMKLSVVLVAMTKNTTITMENGTSVNEIEFDWDKSIQGVLLSSIYYGYILTQVLGGWLAGKFGGHIVFGVGIGLSALFTLITPFLLVKSHYPLLVIRILEGLVLGVTMPSLNDLWPRWAPAAELSRMTSVALSGVEIGTVLSMVLSGVISSQLGWEYVFYIMGGVGMLWAAAWLFLIKRSPQVDPHVSQAELKYIQETCGAGLTPIPQAKTHPWKSFATSLPLLALIVAHFVLNWGFFTLGIFLPIFVTDNLKLHDVNQAALVSAVPFFIMGCLLQSSGHLSDYLFRKNFISKTNIRKLFICGAFSTNVICLILAGALSNAVIVTFCLSLGFILEVAAWTGISVNHMDLAPDHSSVLMGITQTIATIPGIVCPIMTGLLVDESSSKGWSNVFYIASGVFMLGALIFGLLGSGKLQKWSSSSPENITVSTTQNNKVDNNS